MEDVNLNSKNVQPNTTIKRSPIIYKTRRTRPPHNVCRPALALKRSIPDTPDDTEENAAATCFTPCQKQFHLTDNVDEGKQPNANEATLPSSQDTYCSMEEDILRQNADRVTKINETEDKSQATYCSAVENKFESNNEINDDKMKDFNLHYKERDIASAGQQGKSSNTKDLKKRRRGRSVNPENVIAETPPDSTSIPTDTQLSDQLNTEIYSNTFSQNKKINDENACHRSKNSGLVCEQGEVADLVEKVRIIRETVKRWICGERNIQNLDHTRHEILTIQRQARALKRRVNDSIKVDLEHVLQVCESLTLQLEYVPNHLITSESYSTNSCIKRRLLSIYNPLSEREQANLPSLKELIESGMVHPGYLNLIMIVENKTEAKGSLRNSGKIRDTNGRVFASAEDWYKELGGERVSRYDAYCHIWYCRKLLLSFCLPIVLRNASDIKHPTSTTTQLYSAIEGGMNENQSDFSKERSGKFGIEKITANPVVDLQEKESSEKICYEMKRRIFEDKNLSYEDPTCALSPTDSENDKDNKANVFVLHNNYDDILPLTHFTSRKNEPDYPEELINSDFLCLQLQLEEKSVLSRVEKCKTWLSNMHSKTNDIKPKVIDAFDIVETNSENKHECKTVASTIKHDIDCVKLGLKDNTVTVQDIHPEMFVKLPVTEHVPDTSNNPSTDNIPSTLIVTNLANKKSLSTSTVEARTRIDTILERLDNEPDNNKQQIEVSDDESVNTLNSVDWGENLESKQEREKKKVQKIWQERVKEWKTNSESILRQSRRLLHSQATTCQPKFESEENVEKFMKKISEKIKTLEKSIFELKQVAVECKSLGPNEILKTPLGNFDKCNQDEPQTHLTNSSENKVPLSIPTPRFLVKSQKEPANMSTEGSKISTEQKLRFDPSVHHLANQPDSNKNKETETAKRNLGKWFASNNRISQHLKGHKAKIKQQYANTQ